jgi:hypothetical protein
VELTLAQLQEAGLRFLPGLLGIEVYVTDPDGRQMALFRCTQLLLRAR